MRKVILVLPIFIALVLAGCGTTRSDRALSGAGIGAGVGAVGGAVTGGSAVTGAIVGGAAGAAVGALTNRRDLNLGEPPWRDHRRRDH